MCKERRAERPSARPNHPRLPPAHTPHSLHLFAAAHAIRQLPQSHAPRVRTVNCKLPPTSHSHHSLPLLLKVRESVQLCVSLLLQGSIWPMHVRAMLMLSGLLALVLL
jgi:hypothetical protein